MDEMPRLLPIHRVAGVPLDNQHTMLMFDNTHAPTPAEYLFIVAVYDRETEEPVYFVTSRSNPPPTDSEAAASASDSGSHLLEVFSDAGRKALGASNDWANASRFFTTAQQMAREQFGMPVSH